MGIANPGSSLKDHWYECILFAVEQTIIILTMTERPKAQAQTQRLPGSYQPLNSLKSEHTPAFSFSSRESQTKQIVGTFRVPSPTSSEEAETQALEESVDKRIQTSLRQSAAARKISFNFTSSVDEDNISHLGKSSSLFSTGSPIPPFQFTASSPLSLIGPSESADSKEIAGKMVVEREPPKGSDSSQRPSQPMLRNVTQPEFGKTSPLHNRFQSANVFNKPKPNVARPEHHRPISSAQQQSLSLQPSKVHYTPAVHEDRLYNKDLQPLQGEPNVIEISSAEPSLIEIPNIQPSQIQSPRPANTAAWTSKPSQQPMFSSFEPRATSFAPANQYQRPNPYINLQGSQEIFNPDAALFGDQFGAADPHTYVDAGKATENIKALLEGAFEDEEDKPRTRGRKKKVEAAVEDLIGKLQGLDVKAETEKAEEVGEDEEDEDDGTVEGLNVKLLPHQVNGVEWMKDKESGVKKKNGVLPKGGILADDMGLGKTIQALSLMLMNPRPPKTTNTENGKKSLSNSVDKCTLVVAPLALIKQWEAEIKSRVSESHKMRVCVHHGPQRTKRYEDLRKYDVVITTYQILVSEHGSSSERDDGPKIGCFGVHWYRIILDEAHTIKNRNAKATQACYALQSEYRWCLTGTPMQNNLDELQSLIKFLRIKPYNEFSNWRDQITRPMSQGRGGLAMKRLQFFLKAFMKRRTKDILKEEGALNPGGKASAKGGDRDRFKITERRVESVEVEFSPEERHFYDRLEQRADKSIEQMMDGNKMSYASALVLLLRLRQACNHSKLVGGNMAKDRDALSTGQGGGTQTSKKSKVEDKEVDDLADLLGGVSVETRKCDVCLIELQKNEINEGLIRCKECEEDIKGQAKPGKGSLKSKNRDIAKKIKHEKRTSRRSKNRKVVLDDSDNDEVEGEWVIPEDQQHSLHLGKAGGTDDEDIEGGGESLASEDSFTDDESVKVIGNRHKVISLDTSEEGEESSEADVASKLSADESSEEDEDSDMDAEAESSDSDSTIDEFSPVSSAKIKHLLTILQRECHQHKFIVFSQFTSMLDLVEPFLRDENLTFTRYDGSMRNDLREASLERLRNDKRTRILLCSLKCGSLGLNLTAASRVVILEPFWNPVCRSAPLHFLFLSLSLSLFLTLITFSKFVEEQAIDRVHRLNQTVDVTIYKLTVANTVEARILELQEKKRALAAQAIEGGKAVKLSMKDILNLFRRDAEHDDRHEKPEHRALGPKKGSILAGRVGEGSSRKITPPGMERAGGAARRDEGVYGRRW